MKFFKLLVIPAAIAFLLSGQPSSAETLAAPEKFQNCGGQFDDGKPGIHKKECKNEGDIKKCITVVDKDKGEETLETWKCECKTIEGELEWRCTPVPEKSEKRDNAKGSVF